MSIEFTLPLEVEYDYQKAEVATDTYPGCAADAELTSVKLRGTELLDSLTEQEKDLIAERCLENS